MDDDGLRYAYGTNGLGDHRLDDALVWLAELGYAGVALTLDHHHLDPFAPDVGARTAAIARRLDELGLGVVVETGARFLLDPRRKHAPTLLDDDPAPRLELLRRACDIAADLGAPVVHLWAGVKPPSLDEATAWSRLVAGVADTLEHAERRDVVLGFEPEPGMLIETLAGFEALAAALDHHPRLGVTVDIGHCQVNEDASIPDCLRRVADRLVHVQIEDMRHGVHDHLFFGEGEIDFPPVLATLHEIGYDGLVSVELTRHSHTAHTVVPRALDFLRTNEHQAVIR